MATPMPRSLGSRISGRTRRREDDPAIIIGIDFGTTYSGVAWALSNKTDNISIITNWRSYLPNNHDKEKSPTAILYEDGSDTPAWGYYIPSYAMPAKWFKLCLLDEEDLPAHIRDSHQIKEANALLKKLNKYSIEVTTDYLRELWEHSIEDIERSVGRGLVRLSQFKIVVTLPAIWPAYAQARMKRAIEDAGILARDNGKRTTLTFISEPEAAALAMMEDMRGRADIKPNDHFIVCDAGGGTVDIITYTVVKTQPLTVRESVKGDGKLCGAVFLDDGFKVLLRKLIPRSIWSRMGERGIARLIHDEWENGIKAQFIDDGKPFHIQIPFGGTVQDHFHPPEIRLSSDAIRDVFRPVTSQVVELVEDQIRNVRIKHKKKPKFVILVGGFGRSGYLYNCIREAVRNVDILQSSGARPWTAVCRGAVIRGLIEGEYSDSIGFAIDSRVARASYGTIFNDIPWDAHKHDILDKEWSNVHRKFWAKDQTQWFLRIGENIVEDKPICRSFSQEISSPDEEIVTELIYSNAINPPTRYDETVKPLCRICWSKIPEFDKLPSWTNEKGETFCTIDFDIRMVANGVSLDFEIFHDGQVVAAKNVAVEFDISSSATRPRAESDDGDGDGDGDYRDDDY